jgi:hypothetical protein
MFNPMTLNCQARWKGMLFAILLAMAFGGPAWAGDFLLWDAKGHNVDASIQKWDTIEVLRRVAASTRWEIYVQPNARQVLPTRFRHLSEGEALRRLLGDLSYAQVPRTNGPTRLYVFRTTRDDATELVKPLDPDGHAKAKPIDNELIVRLKPGESIEELARRLGAKVVGRLGNLNTYRLKFADADATTRARESLLTDPSVAAVDYNYDVPRPESADTSSMPAPRLSLEPKAPPDGKYLIVGLIDSAVQTKAGNLGGFMMDQISVAGNSAANPDSLNHGTAMAETVLNGLAEMLDKNNATAVRILPVDVYGGEPSTTTFSVAEGIYAAVEKGAKIINLSLGGTGDSSVLHDVIASSRQQGVIFFAAAGNEPVSTPTLPAAYPEVTAVTALDRTGAIASYANWGDFIKAAGPSTVAVTFNDQTYIVTGTSASTAYVTGVAAGAAEKSGKPLTQIEQIIPSLMPVKKQ